MDCSYSSPNVWDNLPDLNTNSAVYVSLDEGRTWKLHSKTNTKRLYWLTEIEDKVMVASTGEFGQIMLFK